MLSATQTSDKTDFDLLKRIYTAGIFYISLADQIYFKRVMSFTHSYPSPSPTSYVCHEIYNNEMHVP